MAASPDMDLTAVIPIIVGANVGTSVTNTVASLVMYRERRPLRRAFCVAAMHDFFNILTALLVLSLEYVGNYFGNWEFMEKLTEAVVNSTTLTTHDSTLLYSHELRQLKSLSFHSITEPVLDTIVQLEVEDSTSTLKRCEKHKDCSYLFQNW